MNKDTILKILFCVSAVLFLLLLSYKLALWIFPLTGGQQETLDFLREKGELQLNYTAAERTHLEDVVTVMRYVDYIFYGLLLAATLFIISNWNNRPLLRKLFRYGGISTVSAALVILIFVLLSFNTSFTVFHQLFFPQGNWQFPADSLLIQTFPLKFFVSMGKGIFMLTILLGSLFILLSFFLIHALPHHRD